MVAGAVDEAVVLAAEGEGAARFAVAVEPGAAANRAGRTGHGEEVTAAEIFAGASAAAAGLALESGDAKTWHEKPPEMEEQQWKKAAQGGLSLFLLYIYRISGCGSYSANFPGQFWRVSGVECGVITLDFSTGD